MTYKKTIQKVFIITLPEEGQEELTTARTFFTTKEVGLFLYPKWI